MATTTATMIFYDSAIEKALETGGIDFGDETADAFGCLLTTVTHVPAVADVFVSPGIDNELVDVDYSRQNLATLAGGQAAGTYTWDSANVVYTAVTASITARYYHVYYDNSEADTVKELVCYGLLDNTPGDVVATAGNTITLQVNASGWFTGAFTDVT